VIVHLGEFFDFIDDREQRLQGGVGRLRVASADGPGVSMAPGRNAAETICSDLDLGFPAPK
jgi:hypothetical protein